MTATTSIEWTEASWNPVRGCSIVSPGCTNCYAMKMAHRFSGKGKAYEGLTKLTKGGPVWTGKVSLHPDLLDWPLRLRKPSRIFVNSMSDLFHEDVPDEFIDWVFTTIKRCDIAGRGHIFQILTKRGERMQRFLAGVPMMRNVWLGVSVEDQVRADERIPLLLQTPAAVRWISAEPLLGPVDLQAYLHAMERCQTCGRPYREVWYADNPSWNRVVGGEGGLRCPRCFGAEAEATGIKPTITIMDEPPGLDWVVVGGESGPGARPFDIEWARSLRDQCRAAGVPVFVKQLGARPYDSSAVHIPVDVMFIRDRKGGDPAEWPEDLRVREYPA